MESLAAISLASAIAQLVDFSSRLLRAGYVAYHCASQENFDIQDVYTELKTMSSKLAGISISGKSEDEEALKDLSQRSLRLSEELLTVLGRVKAEGPGFKGAWHTVRIQLRRSFSSRKIKSLREDLGTLQAEIGIRLLSILRDDQSDLQTTIYKLVEQGEKNGVERIARLSEAKQEIVNALRLSNSQKIVDPEPEEDEEGASSRQCSQMNWGMLATFDQLCSDAPTSLAILESLRFPEMQTRQNTVEEAYDNTYRWIFDTSVTQFNTWLQTSADEISARTFWIKGKAGSGKSTLMKFITSSDRTRELLQQWAAPQRLIVAQYYFWNAGSHLQKSIEGLLQDVLFKLLRAAPELIPGACSRRWNSDSIYHRHPDTWVRKELISGIQHVVEHLEGRANICLFIDGLDEYEDKYQDPYILIKTIQGLVARPHVKICVSSRPRKIFQSQFAHLKYAHVKLEDLTQEDMRTFIAGELVEDFRFQLRSREDPLVEELAKEIQERASGVFLWVFLVIRSLKRGFTEGDNIAKLQERLRLLPTDLRTYFHHMLIGIDEAYRIEAARVLLLASSAEGPLLAGPLYFIDADREEKNFVFNNSIAPVRNNVLVEWVQETAERLSSWCPDLLEVKQVATDATVHFLHRTVLEFLKEHDVQKRLLNDAGPSFEPQTTLCRLYLAWIKALPSVAGLESSTKDDDPYFRISYSAIILYHARKHEICMRDTPTQLLDELDKTCSRWNDLQSPECDSSNSHRNTILANDKRSQTLHWTSRALVDGIESTRYSEHSNFLAYTAHFGLELYLRHKLAQMTSSQIENHGDFLLKCAQRSVYYDHIGLEAGPTYVGIAYALQDAGFDYENSVEGSKLKLPDRDNKTIDELKSTQNASILRQNQSALVTHADNRSSESNAENGLNGDVMKSYLGVRKSLKRPKHNVQSSLCHSCPFTSHTPPLSLASAHGDGGRSIHTSDSDSDNVELSPLEKEYMEQRNDVWDLKERLQDVDHYYYQQLNERDFLRDRGDELEFSDERVESDHKNRRNEIVTELQAAVRGANELATRCSEQVLVLEVFDPWTSGSIHDWLTEIDSGSMEMGSFPEEINYAPEPEEIVTEFPADERGGNELASAYGVQDSDVVVFEPTFDSSFGGWLIEIDPGSGEIQPFPEEIEYDTEEIVRPVSQAGTEE